MLGHADYLENVVLAMVHETVHSTSKVVTPRRYKRYFLIAFLLVVLLDFSLKTWATTLGWVSVNAGVSLALLSFMPAVVLAPLLTLVTGAVLWWLVQQQVPAVPVGLLIGGAAANILDRILYGGVRDWLPVPWLPLENNLADWFILIGMVWIVWHQRKSKTLNFAPGRQDNET